MKKFAAIILSAMLLSACTPQAPPNDAKNSITPAETIAPQPTEETLMYETDDRICVNQIGYNKDGDKRFWCLDKAETFTVVIEETQEVVYSGSLSEMPYDSAIGHASCYGDFTEVNAPGRYFIAIDDKKSYSFEIAENVYGAISDSLLKMLYFQRCGVEIESKYAGEEYAHAACHLTDGSVWGEDTLWNAPGGWHDAGDYGKYTVPCARTVADLLFAYQLYPQAFSDDTNIPESGNGIPDVLDEAKVGLSWMLLMQRDDGGVYHKYTKANFAGMVMPELDFMSSYAITISPTATASFAAIMAKASAMYEKIDAEFAKKCKDAALISWQFLVDHPDMEQFQNPDGVTTGDYRDTSDRDERYWAAAELYLATGDEQYLAKAKELYSHHTALFWSDTLEWYDVGFLGTFTYLLSDMADTDSDFYAMIKKDTIETADKLVQLAQKKAFGIAMDNKDYIWGSNMVLTNRANVLLTAYRLNPDEKYISTAQAHFDWLLGQNALGQCYVTGFGAKSVMYPHHRPSVADKVKAPVPGMVAGGPNANMQDSTAEANFDSATPPALCYADETAAYSLNEVTTYWNSSALFLAAGLSSNK